MGNIDKFISWFFIAISCRKEQRGLRTSCKPTQKSALLGIIPWDLNAKHLRDKCGSNQVEFSYMISYTDALHIRYNTKSIYWVNKIRNKVEKKFEE